MTQQFLQFSEDLRLRCRVYDRLRVKVESRQDDSAVVVTVEKWTCLQQRWNHTTARTRVWLWKLDNSLPGRVGRIGDWLYRSEELLAGLGFLDQRLSPDEAAKAVNEQLKSLEVCR